MLVARISGALSGCTDPAGTVAAAIRPIALIPPTAASAAGSAPPIAAAMTTTQLAPATVVESLATSSTRALPLTLVPRCFSLFTRGGRVHCISCTITVASTASRFRSSIAVYHLGFIRGTCSGRVRPISTVWQRSNYTLRRFCRWRSLGVPEGRPCHRTAACVGKHLDRSYRRRDRLAPSRLVRYRFRRTNFVLCCL